MYDKSKSSKNNGENIFICYELKEPFVISFVQKYLFDQRKFVYCEHNFRTLVIPIPALKVTQKFAGPTARNKRNILIYSLAFVETSCSNIQFNSKSNQRILRETLCVSNKKNYSEKYPVNNFPITNQFSQLYTSWINRNNFCYKQIYYERQKIARFDSKSFF